MTTRGSCELHCKAVFEFVYTGRWLNFRNLDEKSPSTLLRLYMHTLMRQVFPTRIIEEEAQAIADGSPEYLKSCQVEAVSTPWKGVCIT
jgi:hypothetical protein